MIENHCSSSCNTLGKSNPENAHSDWLQIYFIELNINHGMMSRYARKVFQKDGREVIF